MRYALLEADGTTRRYQHFDQSPPALADAKGLRWEPAPEQEPAPLTKEQLNARIDLKVAALQGQIERLEASRPT